MFSSIIVLENLNFSYFLNLSFSVIIEVALIFPDCI